MISDSSVLVLPTYLEKNEIIWKVYDTIAIIAQIA